jgi:RNA binding exosome subunit
MRKLREGHIVMTLSDTGESLQGPIQSGEVSFLVHSTEDQARIEAVVVAQLGLQGEATREEMLGHFGNRIIRTRLHLTGEEAERALSVILSRMSPAVKRRLRDEMERHLDQHSALYVRLDKQGLFEGRLELADSDPVRIRVKLTTHLVREGAASFFGRLLA